MKLFNSIPLCRLFLLVLCLLISGCLAAKKYEVSGSLYGEHLWDGVVYIRGDVTLEKDVRLTILPGTHIRFLPAHGNEANQRDEHPYFPGSELIVKGRILAVGTAEKPIVFESADPYDSAGTWGAVNLEGSEEAVFEYNIFRQADSAVHSRQSNVYIENSVFENNLVAVRFHDSEILVEKNLIRNNHTGIRFHFGSPVICENQFLDNNVNLFITSYPRDYRIENNTFGMAAEYQVVLGEQVPDDVIMQRNFWIIDESKPLTDYFYDGHRDDYLGKILTNPVRSTASPQAGPSWSR